MITETGFTRPNLEQIEQAFKDAFKARFSEVINGVVQSPSLEPESFLGALSSVLAQVKNDLYEDVEDSYYSNFLTTANGIQLDRVAIPTIRRAATFSEAEVEFIGDPDTVIDAGFVVETEDKRRYALRETLILDEYGYGLGVCVALVAGIDGNAPENSLTFIPVPLDGLVSCSNPQAADGGEDIEDDPSFRARALEERADGVSSSIAAIIGNVLAVPGVTDAIGVENTTQEYDGIIPPGGFEITVRGGDDVDIATAIFEKRPAGNPSAGTESVVVYDVYNNPSTEKFSRVQDVTIFVAVTLYVNTLYSPAASDNDVRQRILDYIGGVNPDSIVSRGVQIGEDVFAWKAKATLFDVSNPFRFPGLIDADIKIGTASNDRNYAEVSIGNNQEAITGFTNIAITVVNS